jgi:hypothetical protein
MEAMDQLRHDEIVATGVFLFGKIHGKRGWEIPGKRGFKHFGKRIPLNMDQFTKINGNHNRKKAMGNGVTVVFFEK